MQERATRLARYCNDRVGDSLRFVSTYDTRDENDADGVVYVRDDLRERYTAANLGDLLDHAAAVHHNILDAGRNADMLGAAEATVYVFENAFVMQLVLESEGGIVVSFDPETGQYLSEFVTACLEQVRE